MGHPSHAFRKPIKLWISDWDFERAEWIFLKTYLSKSSRSRLSYRPRQDIKQNSRHAQISRYQPLLEDTRLKSLSWHAKKDREHSQSSVWKVRLIQILEYIRIMKLRNIKTMHVVVILLMAFALEWGWRKFEVTPGGGGIVGIWLRSMNEYRPSDSGGQSNANYVDDFMKYVDNAKFDHPLPVSKRVAVKEDRHGT